MAKKKVERRGFRSILLPVSRQTHTNIRCLALLKELDLETYLSQVLFITLRKGRKPSQDCTRPYANKRVKKAVLVRFLIHTNIAAQIKREYGGRPLKLQSLILGIVDKELSHFDKMDCLCGCGVVLSPFIRPSTLRPRWFVKGHNLLIEQEKRPREEKFIEALLEGPLTIEEVSKLVGESRKQAANFLSELFTLNLVARPSRGVYDLKRESDV